MSVRVLDTPFDPWACLADYERQFDAEPGAFGASAVFVGTMRELSAGKVVQSLYLEHYPGMTEASLEAICGEAMQRWSLHDALILHRTGELPPGEPIVLVAVWSAHRKEAFEACRYLIEELKSRVPFWKKERSAEGSHWVAANTPP